MLAKNLYLAKTFSVKNMTKLVLKFIKFLQMQSTCFKTFQFT